jgi:hypothetical protein
MPNFRTYAAPPGFDGSMMKQAASTLSPIRTPSASAAW